MTKLVCFDFDDVIVDNRILLKLPFIGNRFKRMELGVEYLEGSLDPKKFSVFSKNLLESLKGVEAKTIEKYLLKIRLHKGVKEVFEHVSKDHKIVIVSTNDETFIKKFLEKHNLLQHVSHVYATKYEIKNGILTGKVSGDALKTEKLGVIPVLKKRYKAKPGNIVYVGDGLTDLPLMKKTGVGILFNPNTFTKAEIFLDKTLKKKINANKLFLVENKDLRKVLAYI